MLPTVIGALFSIGLGLIFAVFNFPKHRLLKVERAYIYRFMIGLIVGFMIWPVANSANTHLISFFSTQPDVIISKFDKIILGIFGVVGFFGGMQMGRINKKNKEESRQEKP